MTTEERLITLESKVEHAADATREHTAAIKEMSGRIGGLEQAVAVITAEVNSRAPWYNIVGGLGGALAAVALLIDRFGGK